MNDLVRSMVFLTGIAAGLCAGFLRLDSGAESSSRATIIARTDAAGAGRAESRTQGNSEFREPATPDSDRLATLFEKYEGLAAELRPGAAEALVLNFHRETGVWQLPGLIYAAAERDPVGCLRALLHLEAVNRCNNLCWEALFSRWIVNDPRTAIQRLLDLPDAERRRANLSRVLTVLKAASGSDWDSIVKDYGRQIAEACGDGHQDIPGGVRERPLPKTRVLYSTSEWQAHEEMRACESGSAAARALAARSAPGRLTAGDFLYAAGPEHLHESMQWLSAQPQMAARLALVELAARSRSSSLNQIADGNLRRAVIRRAAVSGADSPDCGGGYRRWLQGLSSEDRAVAAEALRMDATLSNVAQSAALKVIGELGK